MDVGQKVRGTSPEGFPFGPPIAEHRGVLDMCFRGAIRTILSGLVPLAFPGRCRTTQSLPFGGIDVLGLRQHTESVDRTTEGKMSSAHVALYARVSTQDKDQNPATQ